MERSSRICDHRELPEGARQCEQYGEVASESVGEGSDAV